jgi:hypothetical protein
MKASHKNDGFGPESSKIINLALQEQGLDPEMIGIMRGYHGNVFSPLKPEKYLTDQQAAKDNEAAIKWQDFQNKLRIFEAKLASTFGSRMIDALNHFADAALKLSDLLGKFSLPTDAQVGKSIDSFSGGFFSAIGSIFHPSKVLNGLGTTDVEKVKRLAKGRPIPAFLPVQIPPQDLSATINITVPPAGPVAKKYVQRQSVGLTSGKTSPINSAYQTNQQTSGS